MAKWCINTVRASALWLLALAAQPALADAGHGHPMASAAVILMRVDTQAPLAQGQPVQATARLSFTDGKPVTPDSLRVAHTEKFHLLVIEPGLSDYHHLHPRPTGNPGEYAFSFTPQTPGPYRLWADLAPEPEGRQVYAMADIGTPPAKAAPDYRANMVSERGDLRAELALDTPLKAGEASLATITISRNGKAFTGLEPVMGAFAHAVGFGEDYASILHAHPMGREPQSPDERGGPSLSFHIAPQKPGFIRLFLQVKVDGKDVFLPFGLRVHSK